MSLIITNRRGEIILILGPMFSGKTTELIRRMMIYKEALMKTLVIKPTKDTRYSKSKVVTHKDLHNKKKSIEAASFDNLSQAEEIGDFDSIEVIGIDEGNFFGEEIAYYTDKWRKAGKIVIISGLNGSYQREHFGYLHMLYPLCTDIVKLKAVCAKCKCMEAHFTHRTSEDDGKLVIGGSDKYESLCGPCFDLATEKK
jgi:thymidine kinase